jgi:hypothetical protein
MLGGCGVDAADVSVSCNGLYAAGGEQEIAKQTRARGALGARQDAQRAKTQSAPRRTARQDAKRAKTQSAPRRKAHQDAKPHLSS